ncbi:MAG: lipopolysaccharide assembly protein LapB [Gammaproteobacteria bacterium]|nr:lipopolysaccharide assembly protein LapB [Gammaproteobacteria bacterium]
MNLLWLLLPIAALSGWWAARRSLQRPAGGGAFMHSDYLKGLNYVLNEQPDKAIEVFIKMLEVDSETVETHLALGNLFRRRGEVDRAIRIHQNLIARPTLSREQRALALLELAMDYMRSGLFDRAEGLFKELVEIGAHSGQALEHLLGIYQQEKEWQSAIDVARRLETVNGGNFDPMIAQFHCEMAVNHLAAGRKKEALDGLKRALNIDPKCVRASVMEAEIAQKSGALKAAIKAYRRTEKQDVDYLPEVIPALARCYRELGEVREFRDYLHAVVQRNGGITPLLYLTELIAQTEGEDTASRFISGELRKRPTIRGVNQLIEYAMRKADGEVAENLNTIRELTAGLLANRPVYRCNHCGFSAKLLHWQCPSCKKWNTVKPVHGVEGE